MTRVDHSDSAILQHAAEIMEKRGWCAGERENSKHQVCVIGAIEIAKWGSTYQLNDNDPIYKKLAEILHLPASSMTVGALAYWSNKANQEVVVKGLLTASTILAAQERERAYEGKGTQA